MMGGAKTVNVLGVVSIPCTLVLKMEANRPFTVHFVARVAINT